jgi:hypothetical protein
MIPSHDKLGDASIAFRLWIGAKLAKLRSVSEVTTVDEDVNFWNGDGANSNPCMSEMMAKLVRTPWFASPSREKRLHFGTELGAVGRCQTWKMYGVG